MGWRFRVESSLPVTNRTLSHHTRGCCVHGTELQGVGDRAERERERANNKSLTSTPSGPTHTQPQHPSLYPAGPNNLAPCGEKATAPAAAVSTLHRHPHTQVEAPGDSDAGIFRKVSHWQVKKKKLLRLQLPASHSQCFCGPRGTRPRSTFTVSKEHQQQQQQERLRAKHGEAEVSYPPALTLPPAAPNTQNLPAAAYHCCCCTPSGLWCSSLHSSFIVFGRQLQVQP